MKPEEIGRVFSDLCDLASAQTLPRFRQGIDVANKDDSAFDPVTEADRLAEKAIREYLNINYPDHAIQGEEFGVHAGNSPYKWIIDPIDGTRAFISGLPTWGTLIGLYENGVPIAGVMHQPFTDERYFACGDGARYQRGSGSPANLSTRATHTLRDALIMTTSPRIFGENDGKLFDAVEAECKLSRYGFDCYAYAMLAAGHIDLVMEADLHIYDIAALIPIIEQAGGVVSDWSGGTAATGGRILATANQNLHDKALEVISRNS